MKITLTHLPLVKQQELQAIVQLIKQFPAVEMLILFGSYARGDWVEEKHADGVHFRYQSDFDLLAIVTTRSPREQERLERTIKETIKQTLLMQTPLSLIVHDIEFINQQLMNGQYFFADIYQEGILLYDSNRFQLAAPRELSIADRHYLAKEDFEYWFPSALGFYKGFNFYLEQKEYSHAAFLLHQVTERLYNTILLVFTRYKPNTHKLDVLRELVNALDQRFITVFSLTTGEEKRLFELLCKAYVDARYKKTYRITKEELESLAQQVKQLQHLTDTVCQEKIARFAALRSKARLDSK